MITPFTLLLDRCGLNSWDAAAFLEVSREKVQYWRTGYSVAPQNVIDCSIFTASKNGPQTWPV